MREKRQDRPAFPAGKIKIKRVTAALLIVSLMAQGGSVSLAAAPDFPAATGSVATPGEWGDDQTTDDSMATPGEWDGEDRATSSQLPVFQSVSRAQGSVMGDLWTDWSGDFSFLDGEHGDGTEGAPYEISTKAQLKALSMLAALGMELQAGTGDGEILGDYSGSHFALMADLDLGGMEWNPIGFFRNRSETSGEPSPFRGYFHGNGHRVSGFRLTEGLPYAGFFGLVEDGEVEGLTVGPSGTVSGRDRAGLVAGAIRDSKVYDCKADGGLLSQSGAAGGIVGEAVDSILEDCMADVVLSCEDTGSYVGGIAGKASGSVIVDGEVSTGDNHMSRIQGKGTVGGICGLQEDTRIYQVRVTGTIGGSGSQVIGGVTGEYRGGYLKVARFEGTTGNAGLGSAGRTGTFIGTRDQEDYFRYGDQVAYLFADTEAKITANVCGSEIPDDNQYTYGDHIGYFHSGDLYYTLVQGSRTKEMTDHYFYEELEEGILQVMDRDNGGAFPWDLGYTINHVTANEAGRPVRGYLVTIPQIDVPSHTQYHEDVAVLEAKGAGAYTKKMDKEHRGAVAAGKTVTVYTSPKNSEEGRYQLEGSPTFLKDGEEVGMSRVTAGEYTFTMPAEDTEIRAVYTKVAASVSVEPSSYRISVVQERTGDRKDPVRTNRVYDRDGKLIATYINGGLEQGTEVQAVHIKALVEGNNDVSDPAVRWSVDDPDLIRLRKNDDEDPYGYTQKGAALEVDLEAGFFTDILEKLEREQRENGYRDPIPDTVYGAGGQGGGVAVLTAATRPSASFEGKERTANCDLMVTFQVKDHTYVATEGAKLDQSSLTFTVTRRLTGSRTDQKETITVTPPQTLTATFSPDYFSRKDVTWTVSDPSVLTVNGEVEDYRSANVSAVADAKWIRDIMERDDAIREADKTVKLNGSGSMSVSVAVIADDLLGNRQTAVCPVTVQFVTDDRTGSGGSSGGSGGSSGGGGGSSGVTPGGSVKGGPAAKGSVTGTWVQDGTGRWLFTGNGRTFVNEWAYIHNPYAAPGQESADWFAFDEQGYMRTGWYTDTHGDTYYLYPYSDGSLGHMVTGWQWIDGKCYYFNPVSDGTRGKLYKNCVTPDGYRVNGEGAWMMESKDVL